MTDFDDTLPLFPELELERIPPLKAKPAPVAAKLWPIEPGTRPSNCDCGATCYWVATTNGKRMIVTCNVPGGVHPTRTTWGQGVAHWIDCPNAEAHRRRHVRRAD